MYTITDVKNLIQQARTEEALQILTQLDPEASILQARYVDLARQKRLGIISHGEYSLAWNTINTAALGWEIKGQVQKVSNDGFEPFKGPEVVRTPLRSQLSMFLDWFLGFTINPRLDQTSIIIAQVNQLVEWFRNFPELVDLLLIFQTIEAKLESGAITAKEAFAQLEKQKETLEIIELDFAAQVGLQPLYEKAIAPSGTAEDVKNFCHAWKKKYPKDATVKAEIETLRSLQDGATIFAVGLIKTKNHLKGLTIQF